jgi:hypothetical protein
VRHCRRIAQPNGDGLRLARVNVLEAAPAPGGVVAIPQRGFNGRVESKCLGSLSGPQLWTRKPPIGARQTTGERLGLTLPCSSSGSSAGKEELRTAAVEA